MKINRIENYAEIEVGDLCINPVTHELTYIVVNYKQPTSYMAINLENNSFYFGSFNSIYELIEELNLELYAKAESLTLSINE